MPIPTAQDGPTKTTNDLRSLSRRRLLALAAGGAGTWIAGCRPGRIGKSNLPTPAGAGSRAGSDGGDEFVTARDLGFDTDLPLTPNEAFYVMKRGLVPEIRAEEHRLTIDGLVTRPMTLALNDLRALPQHTLMRTLECIGNDPGGELIGNAVWTGARFADVLALADPLPAGVELHLASVDGFHTGVTTALAQDPESYLVWLMNGVPLPPEHGFPIRCLFPGRYGQKQPKWLSEIHVLDARHRGYYERQGWSDEAAIVANSRIDAPAHRASLEGPIEVRGIAFADASGVARVEVVVDNGPSGDAVLVQAPAPDGPLSWTAWSWTWHDPPPGNHVIRARATDGQGRSQQKQRRSLLGGEAKEGRGEMDRVSVTILG